MAIMDAVAIRKFVRDHLDVDSSELPDSLLDVFMRDGFSRIIAYFDESPVWLQVEYSFTATVGQQAYNLDTTPGLITPTPLQTIDEVRSPYFSLTPRQHRQVRAEYRANAPLQARPQEFSIWGRTLYLWPKPADAATYTVLGIRRPNWDWVGTTGSTGIPDLPEDFHMLLAQWTLARGYAQQDDLMMAGFYRDEFGQELRNLAKRWTTNDTALPMIMNGGRRVEPYRTQKNLGPLIYTWE